MKLFSALIILSATISMAVAAASDSATTCTTGATGGAGAHVPIGKDGEGLYTASTKGWYVTPIAFSFVHMMNDTASILS